MDPVWIFLAIYGLIFLLPLVLLPLVLIWVFRSPSAGNDTAPKTILVLTNSPGTQSPRALAHVSAISAHTSHTPVLVAQSPLPPDVSAIEIPAMGSVSEKRSALTLLVRLLRAARVLWCALDEAWVTYTRIACIVVNAPPAIPTLLVVFLWAKLRGNYASVIVDWHNTSHSILSTTGASPRVVRWVATLERISAKCAAAHWCVSRAFKEYLREWRVDAVVVYDAPPKHFGSLRELVDAPAAHSLLQRVAVAAGDTKSDCPTFRDGETALTVHGAQGGKWLSNPVRLAVTSTSWTPDEDFSVLFAALLRLDEELRSNGALQLLVVITGKGPLRAAFERRVEKAAFVAVKVWFAWLRIEDYPKLLGVADVGISMHTSSSELDLPMKVVDMLGCGLPVVAYRYRCIGELVREGENGMLFGESEELANVLRGLLFEKGGERRLRVMRRNAVKEFGDEENRWEQSWKRDALPSLCTVLGEQAALQPHEE